jgi:hypothetical protein
MTTDPEQPQPWISVEERLPDPQTLVFGWTRDGALGVFSRDDSDDDGWVWARQGYSSDLSDPSGLECDDEYDVTHWMPIPEGPRL